MSIFAYKKAIPHPLLTWIGDRHLCNNAKWLWHPIGQHSQSPVRLLGVIIGQMNAKIVHAIHAFVHGELHRQNGAFARLQSHRTDGKRRRSTALYDFDVGILGKSQGLISHIRDLKGDLSGLVEFHITQVNFFLVHLQAGRSSHLEGCFRRGILAQGQKSQTYQQHTTQGKENWQPFVSPVPFFGISIGFILTHGWSSNSN
jgi:hypothetical protein